ncbi:MAG: HYR domain-containing protein [Lewinellaceae bacterium]|nr:HYR domain-containing protein [Lewinellaceae bacterium]
MKTGISIFLFIILATIGLKAQEVINASGNFFASSEGSFSWSLGEVTVFTLSGNDAQLTQGFQQPLCPYNLSISCPENITTNNDDGICGALVNYALPSIADNCGAVTLAQTGGQPSGSTFPLGTTTVAFAAIDASGRTASCSFSVTVVDAEAPVAVCPASIPDVVLDANGNAPLPANIGDGSSTDNCVVAETSPTLSFTCADLGVQNVTLTATDAHGNSSTVSCSFQVVDNTPPSMICHDIIASLDANGQFVLYNALFETQVTDNCGVAPGGAVVPNMMTCADAGQTVPVVVWRFDVNDNTNTCNANVTVVDDTAPMAVCPASIPDVVLDANGNATLPANIGDGSSTDNCSATETSPALSFSCADLGVQTVTLTATDPSGNTNTAPCSFNVVDNQTPTLICPPNILAENDPGSCTAFGITGLSPTYSDNCSVDLTYELEITPQETGVSYSIFGNNSPLGSANIPVGTATLTYTLIDASGNSATCSTSIEVVDAEAPTIICPNNIVTVNDPGQCGAMVSFDIEYFDNCALGSDPLELVAGQASGTFFPVGVVENTFAVTDFAGNATLCTFPVTVQDTEAPNALCQSYTTQLNFNGETSITAANVDGGSSDNCDIQSMSVSPNSFDETNLGANTVTLTVTDIHGNSSSCSTTVTVTGRATALSYTGATDEQYSDQASLSATLLDDLTGDPIQGRELLFTIGSQTASATTDANGLASATIVLNQAPTGVNGASYTVDVDFIPAAGDWFLGSFQSQDFGIIPEDPIVTYTGVVYASTGGANNSEATLTLTATIQDDPNDGYPGDVSNAVVQFYNSETGDTIGDPLNVMLVNPNDPSTGTVLQNWTVDIQNKDVESYEIGIKVLSYYHREFEADEIITVSRPLNDYVKGGGNFYLENSEGVYAGDDNSALRFSINGKFTPNGNNPKGKVHFLVDRLESDGIVHTYRFKSNNILSVGINSSTNDGWVTGKCSVQDVTDPGNPISLGGNRTFQVEVQDNGQPGALDSIGIAVYHQNGSLLFSSKWSGVQTLRDTLDKGDIEVSAGAQAMTGNPDNGPTALKFTAARNAEESLQLFPNPARHEVNLRVDLAGDKDIQVELVGANGQTMRMQSFTSEKGENTFRIDLKGLPAGTYWVRITGQDTLLTTSLIVVE